MYRLQLHQADRWQILDERDDTLFQGSLKECEAWLDAAENLPAKPQPDVLARWKLSDLLRRWWGARTSNRSPWTAAADPEQQPSPR